MSLILTRKAGEAIVAIEGGVVVRRIFVVSVDGNTVRLALDAAPETKILREELLPEADRRRFHEWKQHRGWLKIAMLVCTSMALAKLASLGY